MKKYVPHHGTLAVFAWLLPLAILTAATAPKVGDKAPDFVLRTLDDRPVGLSKLTSTGPVVLIVLRGWPGYQCPVCTSQVQDYIAATSDFAAAGAQVLMVYPGPAPELNTHAKDFLNNKQWPKDFLFVTDPDYTMLNTYGLRWDARGETSYPSTFVVDGAGIVRFVKISKSHGSRTKAKDVLEEIKKISGK